MARLTLAEHWRNLHYRGNREIARARDKILQLSNFPRIRWGLYLRLHIRGMHVLINTPLQRGVGQHEDLCNRFSGFSPGRFHVVGKPLKRLKVSSAHVHPAEEGC